MIASYCKCNNKTDKFHPTPSQHPNEAYILIPERLLTAVQIGVLWHLGRCRRCVVRAVIAKLTTECVKVIIEAGRAHFLDAMHPRDTILNRPDHLLTNTLLQGLRDLLPRPKLTPVKICPVFAPHNDGSAHANH